MASTPITEHKLARLCGLISLHKKNDCTISLYEIVNLNTLQQL